MLLDNNIDFLYSKLILNYIFGNVFCAYIRA